MSSYTDELHICLNTGGSLTTIAMEPLANFRLGSVRVAEGRVERMWMDN